MSADSVVERLVAERSRFRAYLVARLGSDGDADEVLQVGLVKAFEAGWEGEDSETLIAWFYRVLHHALVDHVRKRRADAARDEAWMTETLLLRDDAERAILCGCFEALIAALPAREATLLRRIELGGEAVASVAADLGSSANNASVILHRARRRLRAQLTEFCGACAQGACLDCDCAPDASGNK